jgi:hypothetical protein
MQIQSKPQPKRGQDKQPAAAKNKQLGVLHAF